MPFSELTMLSPCIYPTPPHTIHTPLQIATCFSAVLVESEIALLIIMNNDKDIWKSTQ